MTNELEQKKYYPINMCYLPLPKTDPGKEYIKQINDFTKLGLQGNMNTNHVPSGLYGRYALMALNSLAFIADDERKVYDFSAYSLLKNIIGGHPQGRQLKQFVTQAYNLVNTFITLFRGNDKTKYVIDILLTRSKIFSLDKDMEYNKKMHIEFTEDGLNFLQKACLPVPKNIIDKLSKPLEFDVYCWTQLCTYNAQKEKSGAYKVSWKDALNQFDLGKGNNNSRDRDILIATIDFVKTNFNPFLDISLNKAGDDITFHAKDLKIDPKKEECFSLPNFGEILTAPCSFERGMK